MIDDIVIVRSGGSYRSGHACSSEPQSHRGHGEEQHMHHSLAHLPRVRLLVGTTEPQRMQRGSYVRLSPAHLFF